MTTDKLNPAVELTPLSHEEEYSIPLDITDIITICQEYNRLGFHIQQQVEHIFELGLEESINRGHVKKNALPHIKQFLRRVCENPYFGDATAQAQECIELIKRFEEKHRIVYVSAAN